jgi:hypothetical protein
VRAARAARIFYAFFTLAGGYACLTLDFAARHAV